MRFYLSFSLLAVSCWVLIGTASASTILLQALKTAEFHHRAVHWEDHGGKTTPEPTTTTTDASYSLEKALVGYGGILLIGEVLVGTPRK